MKPLAVLVALAACSGASRPQAGDRATGVGSARDQLIALLLEADTDADGRITVRDRVPGQAPWFVKTRDGWTVPFQTPFRLAHVADLHARELAGIERYDRARAGQARHQIVRGLVDRSWQPLVRRSDRIADIVPVLRASRVQPADGKLYVYYPESDAAAGQRLRADAAVLGDAAVVVVGLPRALDQAWLERLDRQPGLLYLPQPYIVPGGQFVEMYGWDSYFMARGALAAGRADLARNLLDDFLYQIVHYGKIGNSNRSFHRGRSQPPFLPRLALALLDGGAIPEAERTQWLRRTAEAGERELAEVWSAAPRITATGLSRYHDESRGPLPEVRRGHYKVWRDDQEFIDHQRAVRESGWDMTLRFGERGHQMAPVCLNALLYGYQRDMAEIYRRLDGTGSAGAARHDREAARRKEIIDRTLWDEKAGLYLDWDLERKARTGYESMASFYALFVGLASDEQAKRIVANLPLFLEAGGLAVSSRRSREAAGAEQLQWDWPYGWAPHQVIAVEGLRRYGFAREADDLAMRWLTLVIDVASDHNGLIVEKYDVAARTANVPVEYGNQGGDRGAFARYRASPACKAMPRKADCIEALLVDDLRSRAVGFGWTNASVELLLDGLSAEARRLLDRPPPAASR
jgi:alpha,alpha-trehalase